MAPPTMPHAAHATGEVTARLEFLSGSLAGQSRALGCGDYRLGRGEKCEIRFDAQQDLLVSNVHAEITVQPSGAEISDAGSRNGVLVNGQRIAGCAPLYHDDIIELGAGGPRLRFLSASPAFARRTAPTMAALPPAAPALAMQVPPASSSVSPLLAASLFGVPLLVAGALACAMIAGAILYIFHRQNQIAEAQLQTDLRQAQIDADMQTIGAQTAKAQRQIRAARGGLQAIDQKTGQMDASIQAMAQRLAALEQALAEVANQGQTRDQELSQALERLRADYGVRLQSLEDGQKVTSERLAAIQAELTSQIEALRKDLGEAKEAWKKAGGEEAGRALAERMGKAVFVCCMLVQRPLKANNMELPAGKLLAFGTAWAFDPGGRLATNAHVVEAYQQLQQKAGDALTPVVVQNGTGQVIPILRWRMHPAYQDRSRQPASDVGILRAAQPLATVFPVADFETLRSLGPGQAVFSIGFPIEVPPGGYNIMYAYDTPERAVATMRCGWIQRITTVDGRLGSPEERRVMHIGINAVGGQSGSPVFTRDGQVVALLNAGEIAGQIAATGQRLPHAGLFTYAVRADALREIADAEAD